MICYTEQSKHNQEGTFNLAMSLMGLVSFMDFDLNQWFRFYF